MNNLSIINTIKVAPLITIGSHCLVCDVLVILFSFGSAYITSLDLR